MYQSQQPFPTVNPAAQGPLHHLVTHENVLPAHAPLDAIGAQGELRRTQTHDAHEQACAITAWQQLYDQLLPGPFLGELSELWLGKLQCFDEYTSRALRQSCIVWPGAYWFGIPEVDGELARRDGNRLGANTVAVSGGGEPFVLTTPEHYRILGLVVPQEEMADYALATIDGDDPLALLNNPVIVVDPASREAYGALLKHMLAQAARTAGVVSNATTRRSMRESLLDGLLGMLTSATSEKDSETRSRATHWRLVHRAREFVLDQPGAVLTIADLCQQLHVSRRTLQNGFQHMLGICPQAFLKAIRLNATRRELQSHASAFGTVQDIAAAWGFWHMSQFAADYCKLFGELPSKTLSARQLRA